MAEIQLGAQASIMQKNQADHCKAVSCHGAAGPTGQRAESWGIRPAGPALAVPQPGRQDVLPGFQKGDSVTKWLAAGV